jgi:hypothetical protein
VARFIGPGPQNPFSSGFEVCIMTVAMSQTSRRTTLFLWIASAILTAVLFSCSDSDALQARTHLDTQTEKITHGPPRVDPNAKLVFSPEISFLGRGEPRIASCIVIVYQDLNANGKRDPEEPTYHWEHEWPQGSDKMFTLAPEQKPLKKADQVNRGTFRYEVEILLTSGGTFASSGEAEVVKKEK